MIVYKIGECVFLRKIRIFYAKGDHYEKIATERIEQKP